MKKIAPLQDLRGIAVLLVVMLHAQAITGYAIFPYSFGAIGVEIFFIISGFIMASIHGHDKGVSEFFFF